MNKELANYSLTII